MVTMNEGFPKSVRLRRPREFRAVETSGVTVADGILVIQGIRNHTSLTRLGLAIGKPLGNAVMRNRWKRLIREAFRRQAARLPPGLDLVVRPRRGAIPDSRRIAASLLKLALVIDKKTR